MNRDRELVINEIRYCYIFACKKQEFEAARMLKEVINALEWTPSHAD